ncbi:MAG: metal-binding protein [Ruminococcaceae bacterium]|nr:metal-binding protein [Oscillospiraceae bacterium]
MGNHAFFQNRDCAFFPCHETASPEEFNCLFCFCPLYHLGEACGGDFLCQNGVKDCSACLYPHDPAHYGEIIARLTPTK